MIFCAWLGRFMNVMMHQSEKQKITVELKGESGVLEYKQKKHRPGFLLQVPLVDCTSRYRQEFSRQSVLLMQ
jgi:hypothetical protein